MAELHKTICFLVGRSLHRDAVILARTLCEAHISLYWLTNKDLHKRFDHYFKFWGQVRSLNKNRVKKWFNYEYTPIDSLEIELIEEARNIFKEASLQWNEKSIRKMAAENDEYEQKPDGSPINLLFQYEMLYFWFSLQSHPSIFAIQNFLPHSGRAFLSSRFPLKWQSLPEKEVVALSTIWLFAITDRVNSALNLGKERDLKQIAKLLKAR